MRLAVEAGAVEEAADLAVAITMMRSHMPISSSISEEIIRMPAPSAASRLMIL